MGGITLAQIRKLHASCRERGIDNDLLHEHIRMLTGKGSVKELTRRDAMRVIDSLEGKTSYCQNPASDKQMAYIRVLMRDLGWTDGLGNPDMERLDGMCRKYVKTDCHKWLDKSGASKIIEALKNMAGHNEIDICREAVHNG